MFGQPGGIRRRIQQLVIIFREKGAVSPDKAMTAQELGLPPRFEQAMERRLGATGVFVEADGKYYLDETKLQAFEQRRGHWTGGANEGQSKPRNEMITLRMARTAIGISAIILVLVNIFFLESIYARLLVITLAVVWVVLTVFQLLYLSRRRRRWSTANPN